MGHSFQKIGDSVGLIKVGRDLAYGRGHSVNELRDLCAQLEKEGIRKIILDFSEVKLCPSMVFGNIIVLAKRLKEKNGEVCITFPSSNVAKAARITGLTNSVGMYETTEQALESFNK